MEKECDACLAIPKCKRKYGQLLPQYLYDGLATNLINFLLFLDFTAQINRCPDMSACRLACQDGFQMINRCPTCQCSRQTCQVCLINIRFQDRRSVSHCIENNNVKLPLFEKK